MWYSPEYYDRFSCLMGQCRHTCCAGWDIDIDEDSLARFRSMPGEIGERLRANIVEDEEGARFRMTEDRRCPMLNEDGLCDFLLACDEDMDVLCDNCFNHPEFDNSVGENRYECGLGLCCEAACSLILGWEKPVKMVAHGEEICEAESEEVRRLLALRGDILACVQDRRMPVMERIGSLLRRFEMEVSALEVRSWIPMLLRLERMDEAWADALRSFAALPDERLPDLGEAFEIPTEQLLVYLLYRHLPGALDDGLLWGRLLFCVMMTLLIRALWRAQLVRAGSCDFDDMVEICRLYSSEIEYSGDNFCAIVEGLQEHFPDRLEIYRFSIAAANTEKND